MKRSTSFDPQLHDSHTESPHDELEREERLRRFRSCLAKLSPRFREVITLCALDGQSYEESANLIGIPTGTIRSRLNKARLLLKDCIKQESPATGGIR